jgi:hypothetical protein
MVRMVQITEGGVGRRPQLGRSSLYRRRGRVPYGPTCQREVVATLTDALRSLTAAEILVAFRQRFLPWDGVALQGVLDDMVLSGQLQKLPIWGEDRYALPAGGGPLRGGSAIPLR